MSKIKKIKNPQKQNEQIYKLLQFSVDYILIQEL
jgi:hypothetical protein